MARAKDRTGAAAADAVHTVIVIPSALETLPGLSKERLGAGTSSTGAKAALHHGGVRVHTIHYSDHSSFGEIVAFVQKLRPGQSDVTTLCHISARGR